MTDSDTETDTDTDTPPDRRTQRNRPRIAVFGYGSLLQPSALATLSADAPNRAIPARVDGLRRVFNQRTSRRTDDEVRCAVANVVRSSESWTNGVVLPDVSRDEFETFRERERWYRLIEIRVDDVDPYDEADAAVLERTDLLLTTTGLETDPEIEPIPSYVDSCLEGAAAWGERFRDDFLASTTTTNAGEPLAADDEGSPRRNEQQ